MKILKGVQSGERAKDITPVETNTDINYDTVYMRNNFKEHYNELKEFEYTSYDEIQMTPQGYIQYLEVKNSLLEQKIDATEEAILNIMMEG